LGTYGKLVDDPVTIGNVAHVETLLVENYQTRMPLPENTMFKLTIHASNFARICHTCTYRTAANSVLCPLSYFVRGFSELWKHFKPRASSDNAVS